MFLGGNSPSARLVASATTRLPAYPQALRSDAVGVDPTFAAKMTWVPHSANATTRAIGNAACSHLVDPRPAKMLGIHDRVSHIKARAVDRDQSP